jgi:argininosuccinate lyase
MSSAIVRRKRRNAISLKKVDISKEIARINQLKSQGLISEEEFEKAKQKLQKRLRHEMVSH